MATRAAQGFFYAMQLYPDILPLVIKFGFSANPSARAIGHRSQRNAPAAEMIGTWPATRMWERFIIQAVTAGCQQVMETETFLVDDVAAILGRIEAFVAANDVRRVSTPPLTVHRDYPDHLITLEEASRRYRMPMDVLRSLVGDGTLRSYPILYASHHAPLCIEERQLEEWSDAKGRTALDARAVIPAPDAP